MTVPSLPPRHLPQHGGRVYRLAGEVVVVKAAADETAGAYCLFEAHTAPGGGTPPHLHRYEDEAVFVLEGMYAARIGTHTCTLGPGAYVFVPRDTVHAFTNPGAAPGRMLVLVSPGDMHERFIAAAGRPAAHADAPSPCDATELAALAAVGPAYGTELDVPPDLPEAASDVGG